MISLFERRSIEEDPCVIHGKTSNSFGSPNILYVMKQVKGSYVRVVPNTWSEVLYIRSLEKGCDLFAPWSGDGVIISARVLPRLHRLK